MTNNVVEFPFEEIYELCANGKLTQALDLMYDKLFSFHFGYIDINPEISENFHGDVLEQVDMNRLPTEAILGFLTCTLPIKSNESRIKFCMEAKKRLIEKHGEEYTKKLMHGLD